MKKVNWKCEYRKTRAITSWSGRELVDHRGGGSWASGKVLFLDLGGDTRVPTSQTLYMNSLHIQVI